jgi:Tetracyclin repressor-like, C-terminal domain
LQTNSDGSIPCETSSGLAISTSTLPARLSSPGGLHALRDAVTERWLAGISSPLEAAAFEDGPALERLVRWLDLLVGAKRKALDEPELFATYIELTADARQVVRAHVDTLVGQLARIIADGVSRGELEATDPAAAARAVFDATARFHNPVHALSGRIPRSAPSTKAYAR